VFAVREHLVLARQERSAGVDQIEAGQPVLTRDLLCAQMFLDGDRVVGAALHRRVVGDDHAFATGDSADACDHSGARALVAVHAVGGQRRHFQQWAARVQQTVHPVTRQKFPAAYVPFAGAFRSAERRGGQLRAQLIDKREVVLAV
jgi:hypothetical protein